MAKPSAPARPEVTVAGPASLRISWVIAESDPEVTASTVKVRIAGSQRWQNYDHAGRRLVMKGGATVPAPTCEVTVEGGLEEGIQYEAIVAVMNSEGWGDVSQPSEPMHFGELKPREKPPSPAPPKLVATGSGKMKCSWTLPRTCPPVEASQVQVTDMGRGEKMLVDASTGKLVSSGRTSFGPSRVEVTITGVQDGTEYVAAVCCRNAEGFGEYSIPSDPVACVDPNSLTSGMELVIHSGPTEVPVMQPLTDGQMKVRWLLPEDAKSTMVKLRRTGDNNWYLCGGTAIPAPAAETVANGLEEGIEYEAMVAFLINGRWCNESPVSKPSCIGELKQPGLPGIPKEPRLFIFDAQQCQMKVKWQLFTAVPALTGIIVKFRPLGARAWQYVDATTCRLIEKEPEQAVPATSTEVEVHGLRQGIRYEAAVAFRNKLGLGPASPPSEIVCIGRPTPRMMKCTYCFADYDLQHSEYTRSSEFFWCPPCRFRQMDPFNAVIEPYGLLMCHVPVRQTIAFSLDLPELKSWRKDDQAVFMRMVKLDSDNSSQVWPRKLVFDANGHEVFSVLEPEEGHVRRDVPKNIAPGLRPGMNTITIKIEDDYVPGYAMALVRTQTRTAEQIGHDTPQCDEEAAKARVMDLLAPSWSTPAVNDDEEEEITCVISNKLKLRCPLSFERVVIPVRGESCLHLQCFGLGAYLESNMKMRALNNRWTCPVCSTVLKPRDLRIDAFVERVLSETPSNIDEVLIQQDGSYVCIDEEAEKAPEPGRPAAVTTATLQESVLEAQDGDIITEVPTTVLDEDGGRGEKRKHHASVPAQLTSRQRRRQKLLTVGQGSENDTD